MEENLVNNHKMITRNKIKKFKETIFSETDGKMKKIIKKRKFNKISSDDKKSMSDDSKNDGNRDKKKSNNSGIDINVEQLAQFMTKEFLTNIKKNKNKKKKLKKKFRKSENRERIENMTEDLESVEEKLDTKEEIKENENQSQNLTKEEQISKYGGYYNESDEFIVASEDEDALEESNIDTEITKKENRDEESDDEEDGDMVIDLEYSSDEDLDEEHSEDEEDKMEVMTDEQLDYWKKITKEEKKEYMKLEKEIENYNKSDVPERFRLLKFPIKIADKQNILSKLDQLDMMEPSDNEYFKLNRWVSGILNVPFGKYLEMPVKYNDGHDKIYDFLYNSSQVMNSSVFGHVEAKDKILQVLSQSISNPSANGNMIALQGPPGIGKTSLVRNGIAKALGRPFFMIALGGATDSSYLEGHHYTYEGATWGRIANILMDANCMNPVIFFDELDKISETKHGEEITGVLTHLTDQTQNSAFNDKYFSGIDLDLSKVLFVFSYNDDYRLNPILKDRLLRIKLNGFNTEDKIKIATNYMIPEAYKSVNLGENDVVWSDDILKYIIRNYTEEDGVRELKRSIETIYLKINMLRYVYHPSNKDKLSDKKIEIKSNVPVNFPVILTNKLVDEFLTKNNFNELSDNAKWMYS